MEKNVKRFFRNLSNFKQATISSVSSDDRTLLGIVTPLIAPDLTSVNRLYDGFIMARSVDKRKRFGLSFLPKNSSFLLLGSPFFK
jgi:hypothetical protein